MSADSESRAREALQLVLVDPRRAVDLATSCRETARQEGDLVAGSIAERALGLAAVHIQDLDVATRHLRTAMALARRAGSAELAAEARMTLAFALNRRGRPRQALAEIGAALHDLTGVARARALGQRAAILQQLGRLDEALNDYRTALPLLRRAGDLVWVQRVLLNRGLLHAFRHAFSLAVKDLHEADRLCEELGLGLPAAFVQENLGFVHSRSGDVPAALHHLDAAEKRYRTLEAPVGSLLVERSELLLSVLLVAEAREAAEQAVAECARTRRNVTMPEARLQLARAAMLDHDPALASREARRAVREFGRLDRPEWRVLARFVLLAARLQTEEPARVTVRQLADVADAAAAAGWLGAALDARLLAGQLGLAGRHHAQGRDHLQQVSSTRRKGPAALRARAWYAAALLHRDAGDLGRSTAAATTGLRILDEHRTTMAATDLRARASGLRTELAQLGLRNAFQSGTPARILTWAELGRARHLLERPARPPADPALAQLLAELRSTVQEIEQRQSTGEATTAQVARQVRLERAIRDYDRRQHGSSASPVDPLPPIGALRDSLQDAALVEYIELDDTLHAVTVVSGRARLHHLGAMPPLRDAARWLPFALRRLAGRQTTAGSWRAAVELLRDSAARFDTALLRPLLAEIADRPLVLIPTGVLQSLPWALLPSADGRPVTIAPSAALWHAARQRPHRSGPTVVVAGPGLPGARHEASEIAALHRTEPLLDAEASVGNVTAALDGAGLAHLAAHGHVRSDNPLFSALRLADGPLTVYDLERLRQGPDTVVLAACESGRNIVLAGDELLGLSAAFLSRDTRQLVASVVPIPDAETAPLMIDFHRLLAGGESVAAALALAQQNIRRDGPAALAAAAGFVCLGAGFGQRPPSGRTRHAADARPDTTAAPADAELPAYRADAELTTQHG